MKLLVFASGRGSNFNALLDATNKSIINAKIVGLICDKNCNAEKIAEEANIPVSIIRPKEFLNTTEYVKKLMETVKNYSPDYILLAGYMRIIPTELIDEYPLQIVNIHPSLLPAFKGKDAILQAWTAGVKTTGVTVHYVNGGVDEGAIIASRSLPVPSSIEALEEEIHKIEHDLYVSTVKDLVEKPCDVLVISKELVGSDNKRINKLLKRFNGKVVYSTTELGDNHKKPLIIKDEQNILVDNIKSALIVRSEALLK